MPYQKSHPKILQKSGKITIRQRAFGNCCLGLTKWPFWGHNTWGFPGILKGWGNPIRDLKKKKVTKWNHQRWMFWCFFLPCIHCTEREQLLMEPWNPAQKGCKILCLNHAIRILVSFPWQSKKCRAAMVWLAVTVWPNEASLRKTRFNPQSTNFCSKKILFFVCVYQHGSKRLQLASVMFSLQVRHWNHYILRIRLIRPSVCIGRHPWHRQKSPRLKKPRCLTMERRNGEGGNGPKKTQGSQRSVPLNEEVDLFFCLLPWFAQNFSKIII